MATNKIKITSNTELDKYFQEQDKEQSQKEHSPIVKNRVKLIDIDFTKYNEEEEIDITPHRNNTLIYLEIQKVETTKDKPIIFKNITFNYVKVVNNKEAYIEFHDCTFKGSTLLTTISNCTFDSCTFENIVDFSNCESINQVNFKNSVFKKEVDFNTAILNHVNFSNSEFEKKVNFNTAKLTNCNFHRTEFHEKADFRYATLKNNTFTYTEFRKQGAFYGATFDDNPKFTNLILKDTSHLYFEGLNGYHDEKDTSNRTPISQFDITNTVINGRIDFSEDTIQCINLKGSTVIKTLTRTNFFPDCYNWETATILKNEDLKIHNNIRALTYKAKEKELYERELWTSISSKLCGIIILIILGILLFPLSILLKWIVPKDENKLLQYISSEKTLKEIVSLPPVFRKLLVIMIVMVQIVFTLPFFIIKWIIVNWSKINSHINLIISKKNKSNNNENKTTDTSTTQLVFEFLSLWIGKVSNNHGQSWGQGMIFTIIVWVVCFGMFYLPCPYYNGLSLTPEYFSNILHLFESGKFASNMIQYINPTNYELLEYYLKTDTITLYIKICGVFWYLLGKALVPYGIYEVVKAFRKYDRI